MRRLIAFPCAGAILAGTLDKASGDAGLLIVSGGNEIRVGAHRGMALLAQSLAARGTPVFRFDRRGIGDSTGGNEGYRASAPDIAAAAATFVAETGIKRLIAFGNCDAATALALFGHAAGIDRLILANPWAVERTDDLPPAAAIRARYAASLRDPRAWLKLLKGDLDLSKLVSGLTKIAQSSSEAETTLAGELFAALSTWQDRLTILLAKNDATAIAFADAARKAGLTTPIQTLDSASHSFARAADKDWLFERIADAIALT